MHQQSNCNEWKGIDSKSKVWGVNHIHISNDLLDKLDSNFFIKVESLLSSEKSQLSA